MGSVKCETGRKCMWRGFRGNKQINLQVLMWQLIVSHSGTEKLNLSCIFFNLNVQYYSHKNHFRSQISYLTPNVIEYKPTPRGCLITREQLIFSLQHQQTTNSNSFYRYVATVTVLQQTSPHSCYSDQTSDSTLANWSST